MTEETQPTLPRLNEPAPDFHAKTTMGPRKLADYKGRWLVMFSHPADFTPVCSTEFMAFARNHDRFLELGCDLLGLSVDSTHSHIAWVRNIKQNFGVDIRFPIIDDISMQVASAYGMIMPGASDTSTVRATFVIDPEGTLRAMLYYPMPTGRSIDEIIRLVQALQFADKNGVATPENWQPGDPAIVPPPATIDEAEQRAEQGYDYTDWYFCKTRV
jgi:peroxiredoxin (alkyl hydroperoxide reductase subunit C)